MTNQFGKKIFLIILLLVAVGIFYFRNDLPLVKDLVKSKDVVINEVPINKENNNESQITKEEVKKIESEQIIGTVVAKPKEESKTSTNFTSKEVEIGGEKTTVYNSDSIKILYPANNAEVKVGDTLDIKVHISDFDKLQSYMFLFQGESIFTKPTSSDMTYRFIVSGEYIENQSIVALGNFYDGSKSFQSIDAKDIKVTPLEKISEFNITPEVMVMEKGKTRKPDYEGIFETAIAQIGETDLFKVTIKDPSIVSYDNKTNSFTALKKGNTVADIIYRGILDWVFFEVIQYEEPVGDPIN